jgi:hypothetical protein
MLGDVDTIRDGIVPVWAATLAAARQSPATVARIRRRVR